jgi:hypothetical protein
MSNASPTGARCPAARLHGAKDCRGGKTPILIVACLVAAIVLAACSSGSSQPTQASASAPAADGATLLSTRC